MTTEFWAPIAQESNRVLYLDIRLMGDNDENREGNLGAGYRQIKGDAVFGVHGWIDRRRTQNNSNFHQMTFGVERLGHVVDARANMYVPINHGRNVLTRNLGTTTPYLAGSGIFYDTNGLAVETPRYGLDGELGYRLPILHNQIDALRVYGGGYHFFRNKTDNVTGIRIRTEAQVNRAISIGARFQYDEPRGSQGFLEATFKFPFSAKKLYQTDGLRSRLDESPERDIDIVTEAKQIDTGLAKPVINTNTGIQQRVLYVDNTNIQTGDGTKENPFNNLKTAEANLKADDVLYINQGNGASAGMDQGIIIDKANVSVIGSGSNFTYDSGKFTTNNGKNFTGTLLQAATIAPIITNIQATTDAYTGNGVLVMNDNVMISGLNITGANRNGIYVLADGAISSIATYNSITITNNIVQNNVWFGMQIQALRNALIENIVIDHNTANGNQTRAGIAVQAEVYSRISNTTITNNISNNNLTSVGHGYVIQPFDHGEFDKIVTSGNQATGNQGIGLSISAVNANTLINSVIADNNTLNNNSTGGFRVQAGVNSAVNEVTFSNSTVTGNTIGAYILANGGTIGSASLSNISANNNTAQGIYVRTLVNSSSAGTTGTINLTDVTATGNTDQGIYLQSSAGTTLNNVSILRATTTNNGTTGLQVTGAGITQNINLTDITSSGNTARGLYLQGSTGGNLNNISLLRVSATNNGTSGLHVIASGVVNTISLTDVVASGNTQQGIYLQSSTNGNLSNVSVIRATATNNGASGLHVHTSSSSSILTNISVTSSNILNNTGNGIYLQRTSAAATFNIDLGGGAFGSAGLNRIFGNTNDDLNLDRVTVSAGSNWWNNGGAAPTRVTAINGGSATYGTPLTVDPRP